MSEQLTQQMDQARSRIRRILWQRGVCWVVAGALGVALVAGLVDWLIHASSGLRLLFLLALLGSAAELARRFLWRPLSAPIEIGRAHV